MYRRGLVVRGRTGGKDDNDDDDDGTMVIKRGCAVEGGHGTVREVGFGSGSGGQPRVSRGSAAVSRGQPESAAGEMSRVGHQDRPMSGALPTATAVVEARDVIEVIGEEKAIV